MADSPGSAPGSMTIFPSAVAAAAGVFRGIGETVRDNAAGLPSGAGVDVVGDPACADTLASTCRLIVQAIAASADGIDQLASRLSDAATLYRYADASALPGGSG